MIVVICCHYIGTDPCFGKRRGYFCRQSDGAERARSADCDFCPAPIVIKADSLEDGRKCNYACSLGFCEGGNRHQTLWPARTDGDGDKAMLLLGEHWLQVTQKRCEVSFTGHLTGFGRCLVLLQPFLEPFDRIVTREEVGIIKQGLMQRQGGIHTFNNHFFQRAA